ncbi:ATP-dependent Clp protease proteolytic subunit [Chlamydia caviae]|uniref:ATP-dependent Clp protease proteolytic subunit 1 n=1 Tax=Chlamydia caviae (strain ATCC VR-813 / DSM 19441 / 03DC25 / GPIC) TaxID=227941 RepID=CLPP1_CHLCV|nr:ATP-dependent Clp protease proteolytic subunit [Chlamydia caviae]Q824C7.1 RecName: Full=ATP-dependent Clp protease proteolytic subunit 1; AltName: Full=Endopeptidase Clp 1 [Chlamydia caviae GPIC]AAP04976.1 ATP-dependent Clp protease, proteolytic subunit [Chlamydia caviae GPIC]
MPDGEVNKLRDVIDKKILDARRVFFSEPVTDKSAADAIKKLWYLELSHPGQPIVFVINSPGGSVDAGFAVWDQIKMMTSPVTTVVTGLAASMGSVLSLCAAPGRRFATPHSRIMIHQPSIGGPITGQATDLDIHAREILKTKKRIVDVYLEATGQPREVIEKAIDRDMWMTADEAKDFGLLDGILFSFDDL